ncbi:MAG TPA: hypothetical protein VGM41_15440 [Chitinophagaceae bacterium]
MLAIVGTGFAILEFIFSGETLAQPTAFQQKRVVTIYTGMLKTSPFIIEHHLRLSAVVAGYCSLILGAAWMVGGFISKATMNQPFFRRLAVNSGLQVVFVLAMLASIRFADNLYSLVGFAFIIHVCAGRIFFGGI